MGAGGVARRRGKAPARKNTPARSQCLGRSFAHALIFFPLNLPRAAEAITIADLVPPTDLFDVDGEPSVKVER